VIKITIMAVTERISAKKTSLIITVTGMMRSGATACPARIVASPTVFSLDCGSLNTKLRQPKSFRSEFRTTAKMIVFSRI